MKLSGSGCSVGWLSSPLAEPWNGPLVGEAGLEVVAQNVKYFESWTVTQMAENYPGVQLEPTVPALIVMFVAANVVIGEPAGVAYLGCLEETEVEKFAVLFDQKHWEANPEKQEEHFDKLGLKHQLRPSVALRSLADE